MRPDTALGEPLERIPLPNAPIERVVAQIRFPAILRISETGFIAPFQEAVRGQYPYYDREESRNVQLRPDGGSISEMAVTHRFTSADDQFRISLTPTFMAMEQRGYDKREVFLDRLASATSSLVEMFQPAVYTRFGIRYIDRLTGASLQRLEALLAPEIHGPVAQFELGTTLRRAMTELDVEHEGQHLKARWGLLPEGDSFPTGESTSEPSFLLDLDGYVRNSAPLTPDTVESLGQSLTDMIYRFFRWTVQDEFLRYYGADV